MSNLQLRLESIMNNDELDQLIHHYIQQIANNLIQTDIDTILNFFSDDPEVIRSAILGITSKDFLDEIRF